MSLQDAVSQMNVKPNDNDDHASEDCSSIKYAIGKKTSTYLSVVHNN